MASEKLSRDNVESGGEKVQVERAHVPQMASHFESLSNKDSATIGKEAKEEAKEETELLKGVGKFEGDFGEQGENVGFSNEDLTGYRQQAQQGSIDALRGAEEKYNQAKAAAGSTLQSVLEKGAQAKESVFGKGTEEGQESVEKGTQAKQGGGVKDTVLEKGQVAKEYATQKAVEAKEGTTTVAGKAKEVVVNTAVEVKDRAVMAGWMAAHYATDMTVEGTKMAADAARGVAGYAGEKVGFVKDKVVETEESVRDYAGKKKEEATRDLEAKKTGQQKVGTEEQGSQGGERSMVEEVVQKPKEAVSEFIHGEQQQPSKGHEGGEGGGVFQAIGETIVEIAHTTKDLVVGQDEDENQGEKTKAVPRTQQGQA